MLGLRQLARHAGLGDVRDDGGVEGSGDADEDERAVARGVLFRLQVLRGGKVQRARCRAWSNSAGY